MSSSTCTSDAPIRREQLADFFRAGCKPREAWSIGTEHEKIGFCVDSLRPIPYDGERSIRHLLEELAAHGWQPVLEDGQPIALQQDHGSITLEPGGQLELSGAPLATIHETCMEATNHLKQVRAAGQALGIGFLALGFQPRWTQDTIPWMPKQRYAVMRDYMPKVGDHGLDMMLRTATTQANLDFSSEADMARKMRVGMALQPLVTALFAASPFVDGKPSGYLSYRSYCWLDTDPKRAGIPACVFEDDFGFESYVEWALDAPMYFVIRDGAYVDCAGASFRDFLAGRLKQRPGEQATHADWALHLSTLFPEVRLKGYLEMRGADAGPWPWICALPALWKGLLYDAQALDETWAMVGDWTHAEVLDMRRQVPKTAMATPFRDTTVQALCIRMVDIARQGLARLNCLNARGEDETIFLAPLIRAAERGRTQAEDWLDLYHGHWRQDINRIFSEAMHV
jgi:glutamate--cysteine ligase